MSIVNLIKNKNLTDATVEIHEALAEIRKSKLMEFKWELGKTFAEARYVSDKPFKKSNVRDDSAEIMKHEEERNKKAAEERAAKKAAWEASKKKQVTEVSDALLHRYVKKGTKDAGRLAFSSKTHSMISKASDSATQKAYHQRASDQFDDKSAKRASNVMKARKKLGLHEVSKALLSRYRGKADDQVDRQRALGNKDKMQKRIMGIGKANQKLNPDGKAKVKATD
jgi:hypothetical protein